MLEFLSEYGMEMIRLIWEHIYISLISLGLGVIVAVPLGVLLTRAGKVASYVIGVASILQTIPSLALLAFMIPLFGVGQFPAIIALFIYSLLPILRNTYTGIKNVNADLVDAARGMGMTEWQIIRRVELPQAASVIMAGIRLSGTYVIAWTTLASYIGAGGLGDFIFSGLGLYIPSLIVGGTIPVTILALLVDYLLGKLEDYVTPINLKDVGLER
ncbi:ABC transporter permease [Alkalibacterium iburiense]|uniref:ABC transporter permease n=1 Tax=Alkalibacterium iburiense TaxID=290589 RepID=A0ABP3GQF0_9LACT